MHPPTPDEEQIFLTALDVDTPAARAAYVNEACQGDLKLRDRVQALLAANETDDRFLETPPVVTPDGRLARSRHDATREQPGTTLGRYRLVEHIGEGGFADVYRAEQLEPVRREVAVKIIKPGMDTRAVIARFEAERQALAMMEHPNIAKIHDAGTVGVHASACDPLDFTDEDTLKRELQLGRPYFVMELVRGIPITRHCAVGPVRQTGPVGSLCRSEPGAADAPSTENYAQGPAEARFGETGLPVRERLELFLEVCRAVQHAHQKGIIHRDLKPSNILVEPQPDGRGLVKIIDFGIAKATQQRLTERTLATETGQLLGTPEYMSPEQATFQDADVDTRSDIYSLGVLLYELLTGVTPFDASELRRLGYDEICRTIRETEPLPPSKRLAQLSKTSPGPAPHSALRIPHSAFDNDLDWITLKCLEKDRNRRYETASGLARDVERYLNDEPVLACPPSRLYRLRKYARRNRVTLAFVAILMAGLTFLAFSNLAIKRERDAKVIALGEKETALELANEKERRASVESAKSKAISDLLREMLATSSPGRQTGPDYTVRELLDDFSARLGNQLEDEPETEIAIRSTIGRTYLSLGLRERAEPHLAAALELRRRVYGPDTSEVALGLLDYAQYLHLGDDNKGAIALAREALAICSKSTATDKRIVLQVLMELQHHVSLDGGYSETEELGRMALALARNLGPDGDRITTKILRQLAYAKIETEDPAAGERLAREAVELHNRLDGGHSENAAWAVHILGFALHSQGKYLEAVEASADALRIFRNLNFHEWSRQIRFARGDLRRDLRAAGDNPGVSTLLARRLAELDAAIARTPLDQRLRIHRAGLLFDFDRLDDAIAVCSELLQQDPQHLAARCLRGDCYLGAGQFADAVEDFSIAIRSTPDEWWFWRRRADTYQKLGEYEKSIADITQASKLIEHDWRQWICRGDSYRALGKWENAKQDYLKSFEVSGAWEARRALGLLYAEQGLWQDAADELEEMLSVPAPRGDQQQVPVPLHETPPIWSELGFVHLARQDLAAYRHACKRLAELDADVSEPDILRSAVWTCVVAEDCGVEPARFVQLAERAVASDPSHAESQLLLGAALFRAGRLEEAVSRLAEADQTLRSAASGDALAACNQFFLAMAHQRLDRHQDAETCLQRALEAVETQRLAVTQDRRSTMAWDQDVRLSRLLAEAQAIIGE